MPAPFYSSSGIEVRTAYFINLFTLCLGVALGVAAVFAMDLEEAARDYRFWLTLILIPLGMRTLLIFLLSTVVYFREDRLDIEYFWRTQKFAVSDIRDITYKTFRHGLKRKEGVRIRVGLHNGTSYRFSLYRGAPFVPLMRHAKQWSGLLR